MNNIIVKVTGPAKAGGAYVGKIVNDDPPDPLKLPGRQGPPALPVAELTDEEVEEERLRMQQGGCCGQPST